MAVQFAGSSSTGGRRRRRLVVNGDGSGVDTSLPQGDGAELESQLVSSEAAFPWVPTSETRIWIYAALIGLCLAALTFGVIQPSLFHPDIAALSDHLLTGSRPVLVVSAEVLCLTLSAQLGILIGWYRSRGKLDFLGRYRVWPCAVCFLAVVAFCAASNTHQAFGEVVGRFSWLPWRGTTVAWLLPVTVAALPIALLLDREMRNCRSSLSMLRLSIGMWLTCAWLQLFQPELISQSWFRATELLLPMIASATLLVGFWLHARIVAYVCPDPPDLEERSAWSALLGAGAWILGRLVFWKTRQAPSETEDDEAKPKRRRKKVEAEETATKKKRKAPTKRPPARTRGRTKPVDDETTEDSEESVAEDDVESLNESVDDTSQSSWEQEQEQWAAPPEEEAAPPPVTSRRTDVKGRFTQVHDAHTLAIPTPHVEKQPARRDEPRFEEPVAPDPDSSNGESDDESQFDNDMGDQTKGMSKRQKRELRKQMRDQERARGR